MVELLPFGRSDFEQLIQWITDRRFLIQWAGPMFKHPLDHAQLDEYLGGAEGEKPKRVIWKAIDKSNGRVVGHIKIERIDYEKRSGVLSRVLLGDPHSRGKGLGKDLAKEAVTRGFKELGLGEVILAVFDFNEAAIRCYEASGFAQYDFKPGAVALGGERWNTVFMKLERHVWEKLSSG